MIILKNFVFLQEKVPGWLDSPSEPARYL